jgi:uncharacterized membrane protein YhaH (DUF805 family)
VTQSRPFAVTLLALLAGLEALICAFHALQYLHILPFSLGPMNVFGFDLLGAILWGVSALCYLWAARSLWQMEEQGWMFMTILSGWIVILDVIELIGSTSISAVAPSLVVSAIVLIYCLWPGTRDKFDSGRSRSTLTPPGGVAA